MDSLGGAPIDGQGEGPGPEPDSAPHPRPATDPALEPGPDAALDPMPDPEPGSALPPDAGHVPAPLVPAPEAVAGLPPPPVPRDAVARFDGSTPMPPLPPPRAPQPPPPPLARPPFPGVSRIAMDEPVSEAVLAIPLGIRELIRQSLDLLTRRDAGLRGASFYIGFILLVTFAPMAIILGLAFTLPGVAGLGAYDAGGSTAPLYGAEPELWPAWMLLAMIPAILGYIAAGTEARSLATAVIGGRVEGRPLRLRESIGIARRRFWAILGAQLLIGIVSFVIGLIVQLALGAAISDGEELLFGVSLVVSVVIGAPFVYVPAGIVIGEVGITEAISRSYRLVRLRKRLALVVTVFGVLSQFIVLFGLSQGLDIIARLLIGAGLVESFPRPLVVPVVTALVFALGTLTFLVEAIAAAPAVHAFAALTHYTHGLQVGRDQPVIGRGLWDPWVTPGLVIGMLVGLLALAGAVLSFPV